MTYANNIIDLSRVPVPDAVRPNDSETYISEFLDRFKVYWDIERVKRPYLPVWDVKPLEVDTPQIVGQAWATLKTIDIANYNDGIRGVLAPSATGADLDNVVARLGIQRLVITPATADTPAVMESDDALRMRYFLSFDRPSAGSKDSYVALAMKAWPQVMNVKVNGYVIHKRRGDVDIVISGPEGRDATDAEVKLVRDAVTAPDVRPEATAVYVRRAVRLLYKVRLALEIDPGPDREVIRAEARARVERATINRRFIGAKIPADSLKSAAYGPNVIDVRDLAPVVINPDPYTIPICTGVEILFLDEL